MRTRSPMMVSLVAVVAMACPVGAHDSIVASWSGENVTDGVPRHTHDRSVTESLEDTDVLNCATPRSNAESSPWYLGVFGGGNFATDLETDLGFAFPNTIFLNDGGLIGLNAGREINDFYRAEAEIVYRRNTVENVSPSVGQDFFGEVKNVAVMANLYRDFGTSRLRPYIGGGVGVSYIDTSYAAVFAPDDVTFSNATMFGFQGMAGLKFELTRHISIYSEYRYFGTTEFSMDSNVPVVSNPTYNAHSVIGGLQFRR